MSTSKSSHYQLVVIGSVPKYLWMWFLSKAWIPSPFRKVLESEVILTQRERETETEKGKGENANTVWLYSNSALQLVLI